MGDKERLTVTSPETGSLRANFDRALSALRTDAGAAVAFSLLDLVAAVRPGLVAAPFLWAAGETLGPITHGTKVVTDNPLAFLGPFEPMARGAAQLYNLSLPEATSRAVEYLFRPETAASRFFMEATRVAPAAAILIFTVAAGFFGVRAIREAGGLQGIRDRLPRNVDIEIHLGGHRKER